jgi:periplasmic protein TonB
VSENRFFQYFCALVGAATLVCGTHLFLLATSDWDAPTLNIEPPPAAAISIELSSGSAPAGPVAKLDVTPAPVAERPAPQSDAPQFTASREEHPQIVAEGHIGDRPALASASATTSVEPATKDELPQPAVESQQPKAASEDIEKPTPTPIMAAESKPEQPSPQVPLPKRASRAAKEKPASKPAAKPEQREQQTAQAAPRWKPMGLAPADTPSISLTQGQPKRLDAGGYSSKIWSALARKKPNAGERGSTTVTFAVGPAGALRFVRVSQSSGKAWLDQLALATVRNAAPLPPPPVLRDGTAAYTIRIDFH